MKKELCAMAIAMCLMTTSHGVISDEVYGEEIKNSRGLIPKEEISIGDDTTNELVCNIDELNVDVGQYSFFYIDFLGSDVKPENLKLEISDEKAVTVEKSTFEEIRNINEEIKAAVEKIGDAENRIWFKVVGVCVGEDIKCRIDLEDYSDEILISVHKKTIENSSVNTAVNSISDQKSERISPAIKSRAVDNNDENLDFSQSGIKASVGQTRGFLVYSDDGEPVVTTESESIATVRVIYSNYGGEKNAYYCEVTAKAVGTTNIIAKKGSKSGKLTITVSAPNFRLSRVGTQDLSLGETMGFLVYTDSKNSVTPKVTSSDISVAKAVYDKTKDAGYKEGYYMEVTGLKEGDATITVDYYGVKKSFDVKIVKNAGWVTIDGSKYYVESDGDYARGYRDIGGFKYYFNDKGVLSSKVGIDVSAYQSSVNWTAVKNDGVDFVIIRVGYTGWGTGSINLDSKFTSHINGALAAGLDVGVYYYSQAITEAEARKEADFVAQKIAPYKSRIKYPVAFDTESTGAGGRGDKLTKAARTQIAKAFCDRVKSYGYTPMIYSNLSWLNNNLDMNLLAAYPVWVAQYYSVNQYSRPYKCWQYTSSGSVSGISGRVDLNVWLN